MEIKKQVYSEVKSELHYLRRVETTLVEDGQFFYNGAPIEDFESVVRLFERLGSRAREHAVVLFLDHDNFPLGYDLWLGGIDFVNIDPRRVLILAGQLLASKIVVCHNHPQGHPSPSQGDEVFCTQLSQLCDIMGWVLLDFVIVAAGGSTYSFRRMHHPALTIEGVVF
jgi:DNA repair protein RadC